MPTDEELFAELPPPPGEEGVAQTGKPKRRAPRMGEAMSQLGLRGRARMSTTRVPKTIENRAREEEKRRLLNGGKNKGVERGFGLASPPRSVP